MALRLCAGAEHSLTFRPNLHGAGNHRQRICAPVGDRYQLRRGSTVVERAGFGAGGCDHRTADHRLVHLHQCLPEAAADTRNDAVTDRRRRRPRYLGDRDVYGVGLLGTPTGTVDFFLCQPAEVTAGGCEGSAGTKVGATKTLPRAARRPRTRPPTRPPLGTYCWRAEYSGDASTTPATSHERAIRVLHRREAALDDGDDVVADGRRRRAGDVGHRLGDGVAVGRVSRRRPGRSTSSSASRRRSRPAAVKARPGRQIGRRRGRDAQRSGCGAVGLDHEHDRDRQVLLAGRVLRRRLLQRVVAHQRDHGVLHDCEAAVDDGDDLVADGSAASCRAPRPSTRRR